MNHRRAAQLNAPSTTASGPLSEQSGHEPAGKTGWRRRTHSNNTYEVLLPPPQPDLAEFSMRTLASPRVKLAGRAPRRLATKHPQFDAASAALSRMIEDPAVNAAMLIGPVETLKAAFSASVALHTWGAVIAALGVTAAAARRIVADLHPTSVTARAGAWRPFEGGEVMVHERTPIWWARCRRRSPKTVRSEDDRGFVIRQWPCDDAGNIPFPGKPGILGGPLIVFNFYSGKGGTAAE